jgi:hypothetical protein
MQEAMSQHIPCTANPAHSMFAITHSGASMVALIEKQSATLSEDYRS